MNKITMILIILTLVLTPKTPAMAAEKQDITTTISISQTPALHVQLSNTALSSTTVEQIALAPVTVGTARVNESGATTHTGLKGYAEQLVTKTFGRGQFAAFDYIVNHESSWNPNAVNRRSGACGLGQANPCSKMKARTAEEQVQWVIGYIADRYDTPAKARQFWLAHSWY